MLVYILLLCFGIVDVSLGYASLGRDMLAYPRALTCDPFTPTPLHPLPGTTPFFINETVNYYEPYVNGSQYGTYKRSSCPGLNTLANRGYINRSGTKITMNSLIQAFKEVYNFGIDNIVVVVWPAFAVHGNPATIDLDQFNDDKVQHIVNCPAAPTRNDRDTGNNININMTLFNSLLSFSKDNTTLTLEDLAEHHHLRHNQSKLEDPNFRFGNLDAVCTVAQYATLIGILGRNGPNGLQTLFLEDVKTFYLDENLPKSYQRREMPLYTPETIAYMDRMTNHIGFVIQRPFPVNDSDGRDVEPVVAKYDLPGGNCR